MMETKYTQCPITNRTINERLAEIRAEQSSNNSYVPLAGIHIQDQIKLKGHLSK